MVIASGSKVQLGFIEETTRGTTPASPTLAALRNNSPAPNLEKELLESSEVRSTRQEADIRHGFNRVVGDIGFHLSKADHDTPIRLAMGGTWATPTGSTSSTSLTVTGGGTNTVVRGSGSFLTDNWKVGDKFTLPGASSNTGTYTILSVVALTITTAEDLTTESPTSAVTAAGKRVEIGTNLKTMTLERQWTDVTQYQAFQGVAVNRWDMRVAPEEMIGGSYSLLGMSASPFAGSSVGTSTTAATTNNFFSAFDGAIFEGGSKIAVVTELTWSVDNRRELAAVVGSKTSPDVFDGTTRIRGQLTAFFEDATLVNQFVNETSSSILMNMVQGSDSHTAYFPSVKYIGGNMNPPQDGPVELVMPFAALEDSTLSTSMVYTRSNA